MNPKLNTRVVEESKSYFTIIPNIIGAAKLSVYAFRLYFHLKQVAGENGLCWQSTSSMANACRMSVGSVSKAKTELKQLGLIRIEEQERPNGGRPLHIITIVDIWRDNYLHYASPDGGASKPPCGTSIQAQPVTDPPPARGNADHQSTLDGGAAPPDEDATSPHEAATSPGEIATSPGELNNIPSNKIPLRREDAGACQPPPRGGQTELDLSQYPADVRPMIEAFCELWKITPPAKPQNRKGGEHALWIREARDLAVACGEFRTGLLEMIFREWQAGFRRGSPPYTVARPGSIIRPARALAGRLRQVSHTMPRQPTPEQIATRREKHKRMRAEQILRELGFPE